MAEEEIYELEDVGLPLWKKKRKDVEFTTDGGRTIIRRNKRTGVITEEPRSAKADWPSWVKARGKKREEIEFYQKETNKEIDRLIEKSKLDISKEEKFEIQKEIRGLRRRWLIFSDARRIQMRKDRLEREANGYLDYEFFDTKKGMLFITHRSGKREIYLPTYDINMYEYDDGEWHDVEDDETIVKTFTEDISRRLDGEGAVEVNTIIQREHKQSSQVEDEYEYELYEKSVDYSEWNYYDISGSDQ